MSDPTKAPAGWYEDGLGARRYWDGDAWTRYVAPGAEPVPASPAGPATPAGSETAPTAVLPAGDEGPTIPFVWGSRGSQGPRGPDAAGPGSGGDPSASAGWNEGSAASAATVQTAPTVPYATVGAGHDATAGYGGPAMPPPRHPFTEPPYAAPSYAEASYSEESRTGPHVVGIIALVVAIVGLGVVFIPAVSWFAWILVPVAFVLSLVGLFLRGAKWPAVTGLVVTLATTIVGIVMFVTLLISSIGSAIDEIDEAIPDVPGFPLPGPDDAGPDPDAGQPGQPGAPDAPVAGALAFGETMTWDDGVALTVSAPEPYTPSEFAVGATRANNVVFTLTLINNSSEALQPLPLPTFPSGDQEVSQVVDLGNDLLGPGDDVGIPPTATIEPGGSVSWRVAWSVDDPSALTLQLSPSFLYPSATFTNVP